MKITLYSLAFLLLIGCSSNNTSKIEVNETTNKADSILNQSKQSLITADQASKSSDSSINQKVEKTVKQITTLKTEVKQLKEENNALKTQLNDATDAGKPFKLLPVSDGKDN
jgi:hypothetical protein